MVLPSNEVLFDQDGTVITRTTSAGGSATDLTATAESLRDLDQLNSTVWQSTTGAVVWFFLGQPYDLTAFWCGETFPIGTVPANPKCHFSLDTTGVGTGTWLDWGDGSTETGVGNGVNFPVLGAGQVAADPSLIPAFHSSATGVVGVRFRLSSAIATTLRPQKLRLFGTPTSPTDYLALWDDTLDQPAADDLFRIAGARGDTETVTFRVKNLHGSLTASGVSVSTPNGMGANNPDDWYAFSTGGPFSNPLTVGSLAAGAISSVITMRRIIGAGEVLGGGLATLQIGGAWS